MVDNGSLPTCVPARTCKHAHAQWARRVGAGEAPGHRTSISWHITKSEGQFLGRHGKYLCICSTALNPGHTMGHSVILHHREDDNTDATIIKSIRRLLVKSSLVL